MRLLFGGHRKVPSRARCYAANVKRLGLACVAVLTACGAAPTPKRTPSHTVSIAPSPSSEPEAKPEPTPEKAGRPVLIVESTNEAPLFTDEVAEVQATIVERLERQGFQVLKRSEIARLRDVAHDGKLREDGPRCAAPPSHADVLNAAHPDLVVARISFLCRGERCNAHYAVYDETFRSHSVRQGDELVEGFASPDDPANVQSWVKSVRGEEGALSKPPKEPLGKAGLIGALSGGFDVAAFHFANVPTAADLSAELNNAALCRSHPSGHDLLISVTEQGVVDRCEDDDEHDCFCKAFARHRFAPGLPNRRLRIHVGPSGIGSIGLGSIGGTGIGIPSTVYVYQLGVQHDEPFRRRDTRTKALRPCFSNGRKQVVFETRSVLDERGNVTSTRVDKGADKLSETERACIVRVSDTFAYRCPDSVGDEVWGRYTAGG